MTTASNKPAAGVTVAFTPAEGSGSVSANPVRTDADGIASASWTLGTKAGRQTLVASVEGLSSVSFVATASNAPAFRLLKVSGDSQSAVVATSPSNPLAVKTVDAFDNAVSGVPVDVVVRSGGGALATARSVSDQNGVAMISGWSLGSRVGANEIEVRLGTAEPVRFVASGTAAVADTVLFTSSDTLWLFAADSVSPALRAADRFGNLTSVAPATFDTDDDRVVRASGRSLVGVGAGVTNVRIRLGNASSSRIVGVRGHPSATAKLTTVRRGISAGFGSAISGDRILTAVGDTRVRVYDTAGEALGVPFDVKLLHSVGGSYGMASAGNRKVLVLNSFDDFAVVVDLTTATTTALPPTFFRPSSPRRSLDAKSIYILNYSSYLSRLDLTTGRVEVEGPNLFWVWYYLQTDSLVVMVGYDGQIAALDARTLALKWRLKLPEVPSNRMALSRDGKYLYVPNGKTLNVDVYSTVDGQTRTASVFTQSGPRFLVTSPDGLELYVVNDLLEFSIFSLADPARPTFVRSFNLGAGFTNLDITFDDLGSTMLITGASGNFAILR